MLVCCVKQGTRYGAEYVTRLRNGIGRNTKTPHEFVCFTDAPVEGIGCEPLPAELPGWWAKMGIWKLQKPLIYLDLDVVVTGDLTPVMDWDGFGIIRDYWLPGFNSSVMRLTGNEGHVWDTFAKNPAAVMRRCAWGDQQFITEQMPGAKTFPPAWFPSWKANKLYALDAPPPDAIACICHGTPKPHEITSGWVPRYWNAGRDSAADLR